MNPDNVQVKERQEYSLQFYSECRENNVLVVLVYVGHKTIISKTPRAR